MLKHSQGSFNTACCLGNRDCYINDIIRLGIIPHLTTFRLPDAPSVIIDDEISPPVSHVPSVFAHCK